jgi:hypothetical protein
MFGKGAMIMVMGAVIIFSLYQLKLNRSVLSTTDNFNRQYTRTTIEAASQSAMNYALNDVLNSGTMDNTYYIYTHDCTTLVKIKSLSGGDSVRTSVTSRGWVIDDFDSDSWVRVTDSIVALFTNEVSMSQYGWWSDNENGVFWITGDTCWGRMHSNSMVHTSGSPVFKKKLTTSLGINPDLKHSSAIFEGGYEKIDKQPMPTNMARLENLATSGNGGASVNTKCLYDVDLYLDFLADGRVGRTVSGVTDTVLITDIAPTGVIWGTQDIHVKGTLNGQVSILADDDLWIDDDVLMADNPQANPNSDDALGLIARDDIWVTNNPPYTNDMVIQAALLAIDGSFQAEDYSSRGPNGTLTIYGSIAQKKRGPVGNFQTIGGVPTLKNGFWKNYHHDKRFDPTETGVNHINPPGYPTLSGDGLSLVYWWE